APAHPLLGTGTVHASVVPGGEEPLCAVCVTVLGLLASQLLRVVLDGSSLRWDLLYLSAGLGGGVPAALIWGLVAGTAATVTLRMAVGRAETPDATASVQDPARS
ncbi:hypothetical protein ABZZ80_37295, partial [Streptomyces sp. NPDC006356]